MGKEFLPVGSVVLLKEATRPIVVIGYSVVEQGSKKLWDYLGCVYPIGVVGTDKNLLFQREQIEKVISVGYEDDECKEFLNSLNKEYDKIKVEYGMK